MQTESHSVPNANSIVAGTLAKARAMVPSAPVCSPLALCARTCAANFLRDWPTHRGAKTHRRTTPGPDGRPAGRPAGGLLARFKHDSIDGHEFFAPSFRSPLSRS